MRAGIGRVPAFDRREAAALEEAAALDAVAAALDHVRDDVIGLLGELDAGLRDAAVVERVGIQRL